ncbi:MAG: HD domain-containing protein [Pirellulales bacterium]|nr:HD domain-containing protein [Pirellulales bacterium]
MLPEITDLVRSGSLVRIPPSEDVPISDRVRRLIDTAPMRRLASIGQLGMVSLVYPGATHSRLEHTLGVYHNALRLLARFAQDDAFVALVPPAAAESFVLAALVHDIGHWPFCHPIEDMRLPSLRPHESCVGDWLQMPELVTCIQQDWNSDIDAVLALLEPPSDGELEPPSQFLASCLSGPIDVDKLDYLQRDSLHAGVPYGRNFDTGRLINSLCVHPRQHRLAVGEKGRTAAEMMVFSRYVMFSEVYWHHAVRSATAMLQRAVFLMQHRFDLEAALRFDDARWIATLRRAAEGSVAEPLVEGIFGPRRRLYKRVAEFNVVDGREVHRRLARRPYWWLVHCAERLASQLARKTGTSVHASDILIDAPPEKLEVDINMDVISRDGSVHQLGEVSPVASALANQQFDDHVKRVRVYAREEIRDNLRQRIADWGEELVASIEFVENELV